MTGPVTEPLEVVERFADALAEWLSSFTVPEALGAGMAEACADGPPWAAAIAGTAVRRAGWTDPQALAWGICAGALAGALEAARASLGEAERHSALRTADGPARSLLAADGLVAAAHEVVSTLPPERLESALEAISATFGNGGPWRLLPAGEPAPAWPAIVPCALSPAAAEAPDGPWADAATAWRQAFGTPAGRKSAEGDLGGPKAWHHPAADPATRRLLRAAAKKARSAAEEPATESSG